jgi:ribonucleoside-diphosphate reductase alpha chain
MLMSWTWYQEASEEIFNKKYKFHRESVEEVFNDVATVISEPENKTVRNDIKEKFFDMMVNGRFIPAGRILANAWPGSKMQYYINCYTIGIQDDMTSIYKSLADDAKISKVGGGVGFDVSPLRPKGTPLSVGGEASGPISFLRIFDASAQIIMTGGARRAAHIALLDVSHPDIEEFITCKQGDKNRALTQFNISVKITDKFMEAVQNDSDWDLVFDGEIYKTVKAKYLYELMVKNAYEHNEPGIFNVDTVNRYNNGWWLYEIHECNPCGEQPIPKYNICDLGAMNLTAYVEKPFTPEAFFNFSQFERDVQLGVRFLDNVLDASEFPLQEIYEQVHNLRRIGLGFTGLGDAFAMLRVKYGSEESKHIAREIGKSLRDNSYMASVNLAKEKGPFPLCDREKLMKSQFIRKLPRNIKSEIRGHGLRNIALNTVAPTGTISFSVGQNCSSGIEPIFSLEYTRRVRTKNDPDEYTEQGVYDYAWGKWKKLLEDEAKEQTKSLLRGNGSPADFFVTAADVTPKDAIDIQAIFQEYVDAAISKTLNLPPGTTFEEYKDLFRYAYESGLKGFTTFNPEGSMKGILEYNEPSSNNGNGDIDYIKRRLAPKRPDDLPCDIHQTSFKGEKVVILVGKLHGSLYEIFVDDDSNGSLDIGKHKAGIIRKVNRGRYDLIVQNGEEKAVVENLSKNFGGTYGSLARFVSMALRHGTPLQFVVDQLFKSKEFLGFERTVSRVLKKYIRDGEKVMTGDVCPDCESELEFREGCVTCPSCAWSKCL